MFNFMNSRVGIFTSCMCSGSKTHLKKIKTTFIPQERKVTQKEKMCYLPTLAFKLPFLDHVFFVCWLLNSLKFCSFAH